jgi:hypothetical protein
MIAAWESAVMHRPRPLPPELGVTFAVSQARDAGVSRGRLGRDDLRTPFHGLRSVGIADAVTTTDPYERQAVARRDAARLYALRLRPGQFFSHETAASLWHAPLPLSRGDDCVGRADELAVHVSTLGPGPLVRAQGVSAHRAQPRATTLTRVQGMPVTTPAATWASLGSLPLIDLVALGDYFCRVWRAGYGRPNAGAAPLTTRAELRSVIDAGRRTGIRRLREAIDLIREDSWSPRESAVRCHIVLRGLPEPTLNHDVYEDDRFIACVDLAYPEKKVAIEYHGLVHATRYAEDVERIAALRAAGWTVIEVTSALFARPERLVARIKAALDL